VKTYNLVVADFPWRYANKQNGAVGDRYETLSIDELRSLMLFHSQYTFAQNCVLALWVTTPFKWSAQRFLDDCGFDYRTTLYWDKERFGTGYWFRGQVEELWVAKRGDVGVPRLPVRNIHRERPGEHSAKPEWFQDRLTKLGKKLKLNRRLELFARRDRPGWRCEGLELTGHDHRRLLT